jgi:hypothetical protein
MQHCSALLSSIKCENIVAGICAEPSRARLVDSLKETNDRQLADFLS